MVWQVYVPHAWPAGAGDRSCRSRPLVMSTYCEATLELCIAKGMLRKQGYSSSINCCLLRVTGIAMKQLRRENVTSSQIKRGMANIVARCRQKQGAGRVCRRREGKGASPVGAQMARRLFMAAHKLTIYLVVVVLPQPGPPVTTHTGE